MKKIFIILLTIFILYPTLTYAEEISKDDIIESQIQSVNIGKFIDEAKKYSRKCF